MYVPPFDKLKAFEDRTLWCCCRGFGERNPQQVADVQKFIFVAQGETCSSYTEFCTYEKPSILPVITFFQLRFQEKKEI